MALTSEEIQLQMEKARKEDADRMLEIEKARKEAEVAMEKTRQETHANLEKMRTRLDLIRTAKEVLLENARSKPVDSRDVSATDITSFANELLQFIDK